ncbi:MAG: MBL fold metallo-hydrolase [Candidatus Marinimicrobia bacterium]|nr:MBL fold metallo-hydrolase [Candidatus Neomarinimicrobiota bacterium]
MRLSIIYDNTSSRKDLTPDWGFAAYIEAGGRHILFDTGSDGHILLENMRRMQIDPAEVDMVFISHSHFDHIGGLAAFLHENPDVDVYVPESLRGVKRAKNVIHVSAPLRISDTLFSTGELPGNEQSLIITSPEGSVVVVGCSHPGVERIKEAAGRNGKIHLLFGGLHDFSRYEILEDIDLVCPTHCTRFIKGISEHFPEKYIRGGVGRSLTIPYREESAS